MYDDERIDTMNGVNRTSTPQLVSEIGGFEFNTISNM